MHVDLAPGAATTASAPELTVTADAKAFLKAANERLLGRAVLHAGLVATRQANNARPIELRSRRRPSSTRRRGTDRASTRAGPSRPSAGSSPTTRS